MFRRSALMLTMVLVMLIGCARDNAQDAGADKSAGGADVGNSTGAPDAGYVAKIGNITIMAKDVTYEYKMLPPDVQEIFSRPGGMQQMVTEIARREVVYQEAIKRGYGDKEDVLMQIENFRKRLIVEALLDDNLDAPAEVTDKEAREFYDKNPDAFMRESEDGGKPKVVEFAKVKDLVKQLLYQERQKEQFDEFIKTIMGTQEIEFDKAALANIITNAPVAPSIPAGQSTITKDK